MPSIFLSHTHIDKPFVERLARDLKKLGIEVWFDKWNIQIGESITWKIDEGIKENDYLGIVLSQESLNSEWVKSELGAAWNKQIREKRVFVIPILYKDCKVPLFLSDRKFIDFRNDYNKGFSELISFLGIDDYNEINDTNWRRYVRNNTADWKLYKKQEFENLVTILVKIAKRYKWSAWVGGTSNPFSITLNAFINREIQKSISIKLLGKNNTYMACQEYVYNPNHLKVSDFDEYIGNTVDECKIYVTKIIEDFSNCYGTPTDKPHYFTERLLSFDEITSLTKRLILELNWDKGWKLS